MVLTLKSYAAIYHPTKSIRTVERMVKKLLPLNHVILEGMNKPILIEIITDNELMLKYYSFVVDYFIKHKSNNITTAALFCCENKLDMHLFCKLAKIK